jgi:hypothetical protein
MDSFTFFTYYKENEMQEMVPLCQSTTARCTGGVKIKLHACQTSSLDGSGQIHALTDLTPLPAG